MFSIMETAATSTDDLAGAATPVSIGTWATMTNGSDPSGTATIDAGSNRKFVLAVMGEGDLQALSVTVTVGGQAPSETVTSNLEIASGNEDALLLLYIWDEATIGAMLGSSIISWSDGFAWNKISWSYVTVQDTDQSTTISKTNSLSAATLLTLSWDTATTSDDIVCAFGLVDTNNRGPIGFDTGITSRQQYAVSNYACGIGDGSGGGAVASSMDITTDEFANADFTIAGLVFVPTTGGGGGPTTPPSGGYDGDYPNLHNVSGIYMIGSISRILSDTTSPNYMWARYAPIIYCQINNLGSSSARTARFNEWAALKADNPLFFGILHSKVPPEIPAYRRGTFSHETYFYRMARDRHDRTASCIMQDATNAATIFNGTEKTRFLQSGDTVFAPNFVTPAVREDWAQIATDMLTGSNLSGYGFGDGNDFSDYMVWYHDSTQLLYFAYNKKLMEPYATGGTGTIVSVDSFRSSPNTTQVKTLTISTQPGSAVVGMPIYFFPHNDNAGFIGYVIESYTALGGGQSQLTLVNLPSAANGVSQLVPETNWRFTINDPDSTSDQTADWNANGTPEGTFTGPPIWVPAWLDLGQQIEDNVFAQTGHLSAWGWNGAGISWIEKYGDGWPSPHEFTATGDNITFENASRAIGFWPDASSHNYDIRANANPVLIEKTMHAMYFLKSMRRQPNAFVQNSPYRVNFEVLLEGANHSAVTAVDANLLRYFKALAVMVGDMMTGGVLEVGNHAVGIEEDFIDLDTNYSAPAAIATYDDAGGGNGSNGYPVGLATMEAATCGEAIYVRRVGDWLIIVNCADSTRSDYPDFYSPSHLTGGYTPQATNDEITAANWTTIISTYLTGGETLRHFNPATYVNQRVTDYLQAAAPTHWGSSSTDPAAPFDYGPQQAHPNDNDGTYTLANTPAIARDPTLNDGSVVDTGSSYFIGPMEAVFLEIV